MCAPALPLILGIGSLVMGVAGGVYQAKAEKQAANYQAKVDQNNADIKDYQADMARTIGSVEEERHRSKVRQVIGSQRAALAANGLDLGSGTPLDLVTETAGMGEEDALTIRYNAMREAWGYGTEANDLRNSAKFKKVAGANQAQGTLLTTGANALGSGYSLYNSYSKKA